MLTLTIILGVACVLLLVMLSFQDNKNTKLTVENSLMKGRMEALQERIAEKEPLSPQEHLTADGIEEAIRHAGYVPDRNENWVRFMVSGEPFYVEIGRLPVVEVIKQFAVDTKEWDVDLLKHSAHLMSDELIMVKAIIYENAEETSVRFFVATLDDNNEGFRSNLTAYMALVENGRQKMYEIYEKLLKAGEDARLKVWEGMCTRFA